MTSSTHGVLLLLCAAAALLVQQAAAGEHYGIRVDVAADGTPRIVRRKLTERASRLKELIGTLPQRTDSDWKLGSTAVDDQPKKKFGEVLDRNKKEPPTPKWVTWRDDKLAAKGKQGSARHLLQVNDTLGNITLGNTTLGNTTYALNTTVCSAEAPELIVPTEEDYVNEGFQAMADNMSDAEMVDMETDLGGTSENNTLLASVKAQRRGQGPKARVLLGQWMAEAAARRRARSLLQGATSPEWVKTTDTRFKTVVCDAAGFCGATQANYPNTSTYMTAVQSLVGVTWSGEPGEYTSQWSLGATTVASIAFENIIAGLDTAKGVMITIAKSIKAVICFISNFWPGGAATCDFNDIVKDKAEAAMNLAINIIRVAETVVNSIDSQADIVDVFVYNAERAANLQNSIIAVHNQEVLYNETAACNATSQSINDDMVTLQGRTTTLEGQATAITTKINTIRTTVGTDSADVVARHAQLRTKLNAQIDTASASVRNTKSTVVALAAAASGDLARSVAKAGADFEELRRKIQAARDSLRAQLAGTRKSVQELLCTAQDTLASIQMQTNYNRRLSLVPTPSRPGWDKRAERVPPYMPCDSPQPSMCTLPTPGNPALRARLTSLLANPNVTASIVCPLPPDNNKGRKLY